MYRLSHWTRGHIEVLRAWQRQTARFFADGLRLTAIYAQLKALPKETQTKWRRRCKATLWGVALCLAASGVQRVQAANITVGGTCSLIDAISSANTDASVGTCTAGSGADTLVLTVDTTLTTSNNSTYSDTGLPVVSSEITIAGNGKKIMRDPGDPDQFRLIAINSSGNLTLQDTTLSGGLTLNGGGAIFNVYAQLRLEGCTVTGNTARYGGGSTAALTTPAR